MAGAAAAAASASTCRYSASTCRPVSVSAALTGFQSVAQQARGVMHEFGEAAGMARDIFQGGGSGGGSQDTGQRYARRHPRHGYPMPDLRDDPLTEDPQQPGDHDPRSHRL